MTQNEILSQIKEWAESSSAYLSSRTDYSRGYKDGILQAKDIVLDIFSQFEDNEK